MSHAVIRGEPNASQLYLDSVLDEIIRAKGIDPNPQTRDQLSIADILFYCLKKRPNDVFMINGSTAELVTNEQILRRAVSLARTIVSKGVKGTTVLVVMRNHQRMVAMYYAVLFAGVVPFMMDPNTTPFELTHFFKLLEPTYVFCDQEHIDDIQKALANIPEFTTNVMVSEKDEHLDKFSSGFSDDLDGFELPETSPDSTIMFLPTSGSTGLPKATSISNKGLIAHLPSSWSYHKEFPKPTELVMILTTLQWMTFTMKVTSCPVYQVPILMSPKKIIVEHVIEMLDKFRPTWTFFGPAFAKPLVAAVSPKQFSSLKTLMLLGAPSTKKLFDDLKEKVPNDCHLCDGYGTTETQGFICAPDPEAPVNSVGKVLNIYEYKIINENGVQLGPGNNGELYVRGISLIKGYYKDIQAYKETFTEDGWYKTGDEFHLDQNERLFFIQRRKFNFKYLGCHVSPEEVEGVICKVPGVQESIVVGTDNGPAAAVILLKGCHVTRKQIHQLVDGTLTSHKRLHGGIAFVDSIPHTHSGKLQRGEAKKLIMKLIDNGQCY